MPQQLALTIYRGDSYHWRFSLFVDDAGTAYDLSNTAAKAEIRAKTGSPVLADLGCVITQPNIVDMDLSAVDSGNLIGKAVWDLQLTTGGDPALVKTVLAGPVTVEGDVTDSTRP